MPVVDAAWEDWLATNAKRGCTMDSMVEAMVGAGFDSFSASAAVRRAVSVALGGVGTGGLGLAGATTGSGSGLAAG
ncbi:MAG: 2-oxoglutarate-dependent dioxygenase, partial [Paraburkholderia sp.]